MTFDGYLHLLEFLIVLTIGVVVTLVARRSRRRR